MFKKLLSFFTSLVLVASLQSPLAHADDKNVVQMLFGNGEELKSFKSLQAFFGTAEVGNGDRDMDLTYRLSFNSLFDNDEGALSDFSRVNLYAKLVNNGEITDTEPFKEATLQVNGQIMSIDQKEAYVRLDRVNVNLVEGLDSVEQYLALAEGFLGFYKGKWFRMDLDDLNSELGGSLSPNFNSDELLMFGKNYQEDPDMAVQTLADAIVAQSPETMGEEDAMILADGIKLLLASNLFNQRDIVAGKNKGFKFFNLNKAGMIDLVESFADLFEEKMNDDELAELEAFSKNMSLSGIYRVNEEHGFMDNLLLRLKLKNMEGLKKMTMNYRLKLSDFGESNNISAPDDFEDFGSISPLGF